MIHILVPAFNEQAALPKLVPEIGAVLNGQKESFRIVVVNDGSIDQTSELLRRFSADLPIDEVLHPSNRGYGAALLSGYLWILDHEADPSAVVVSLNADRTHGPAYIPALVSKVRQGWDVVTASYTIAGGGVTGVPLYRGALSKIVNGLFRVFCRVPGARTYSNGFRAYSVGALRRAHERFGVSLIEETGFAGGAELFLNVMTCVPRAAEVPFILHYECRDKDSKIRFIPTICGYLRLIRKSR